jgi:hypothetical protein
VLLPLLLPLPAVAERATTIQNATLGQRYYNHH